MRENAPAVWELLSSATRLLPALTVIAVITLAAALIAAVITFAAVGDPSARDSDPLR